MQRPLLKPRPQHNRILSIEPRPPQINRDIQTINRVQSTLTKPAVRVNKTLKQAIDPDKLSAMNQARWDAGLYGSIELKQIKGHQYYYLRWKDPETKKNRSTYLAKDWERAIAKLKKLTGNTDV